MRPGDERHGGPDVGDDPDVRLIEQRVADLLRRRNSASDPAERIWAAQFDLGLAWVSFPKGLGGLGMTPARHQLVNDKLAAAGIASPATRNQIGIGVAAPAILRHGTARQHRRYLRPCFCCEEVWCQLFSEPGAGSDLANLSTSARLESGSWTVHGSKMWTSYARIARWGLLLARTDPHLPKHQGLTCFMLDMTAPGVSIRPIRQLDGYARVSEVTIDGAAVPDSQRLGEVNGGWQVALTALSSERVMLGAQAQSEPGTGHIAAAVRTWRAADGPAEHADRLVDLWIRAELNRLTAVRAEADRARGEPGAGAAVGKLVSAELQQEIYDFCMDVLGPGSLYYPGYDGLENAQYQDAEHADVRTSYLSSRRTTIAGGTSEIMRNVLADRVLGLPPEPRVDKEPPWLETRRS